MKIRSVAAASAAVLLLLTACGSDTDETPASESPAPMVSTPSAVASSPAADQAPAEAAPAATGTTVVAGDSEYGDMLFDANNQAIYIWEVETSSTPQCYDDCAEAWPPVLTDGAPVAGSGVNAALLGTAARTDGTTQVTYNGHPLYFYAHEAPGEVKCHNVSTHGGLWWVVQPDGNRAA